MCPGPIAGPSCPSVQIQLWVDKVTSAAKVGKQKPILADNHVGKPYSEPIAGPCCPNVSKSLRALSLDLSNLK